jgi:type III pantothenate kinase
MLLLIDAGNTRVKWAVSADGPSANASAERWAHIGQVTHADLEQLAHDWQALSVQRVVVSNVAGHTMRERLQAIVSSVFGAHTPIEWFVSQAECAGVVNGYRQPEQLGSDRFATLIGAKSLFPETALVVATCGTATTVDTLTADGRFIGGMILPGLGMMATSLALNTAQLPQIAYMADTVSVFANNTTDAIVSGCIAAQVGAIERVLTEFLQQYGSAQCIVAGGAGSILAPHLTVPCVLTDHLVLTGLHVATTMRTP